MFFDFSSFNLYGWLRGGKLACDVRQRWSQNTSTVYLINSYLYLPLTIKDLVLTSIISVCCPLSSTRTVMESNAQKPDIFPTDASTEICTSTGNVHPAGKVRYGGFVQLIRMCASATYFLGCSLVWVDYAYTLLRCGQSLPVLILIFSILLSQVEFPEMIQYLALILYR